MLVLDRRQYLNRNDEWGLSFSDMEQADNKERLLEQPEPFL
jgi:hypothetical protein